MGEEGGKDGGLAGVLRPLMPGRVLGVARPATTMEMQHTRR